MTIYINRNGEDFGPYTFEEVRTYSKEGALQANDLAWYEGCQDWIVLAKIPGLFTSPPPAPESIPRHGGLMSEPVDATLVRRISEYLHVSGVIWIVLAILQILSIVGIIAGAWNLYAGITRLNAAKLAQGRDHQVVKGFESISGLVVIAVINLLLGGFIGIILVGFDFFIRDRILKNAHLFTGGLQSQRIQRPMRVVTPNRQLLNPSAPPMGILLPPRNDGN